MEWALWLFVAVIAAPVVFMVASPVFKASKENARQAAAARLKAQREAEKARAAWEKEEKARAIAEQKKTEAAARKAEQERRKAEREAEQRRKQAEKLAAARELAELRERALQAEKELRALKSGKPAAAPAPAKPAAAPAPVKDPANNAAQSFPQKFAGEVVAFTGTLPTMTRAEAIIATEDRGGRAYQNINTKCTLLVIGQRPGANQMDRAKLWNIETITWEEWFARAEISWRRRQYAQAMRKENRAA